MLAASRRLGVVGNAMGRSGLVKPLALATQARWNEHVNRVQQRSLRPLSSPFLHHMRCTHVTPQQQIINDTTAYQHPAFEIVKREIVSEYDFVSTILKHKRTGAEIWSVEKNDDNKVFGITFRTPVDDSTGIPHILEHSVLCGSRKFPTKEPFVELLKGSLQTFLNAFTYPDRTCYPVASQNHKDLYNLIHVYMDAVFHPRAINDPMVLDQEGWHYELESPEDKLKRKGVVFNEMKGVYSQPQSLIHHAAAEALFPDTTYRFDSGGNPKDIPALTFDRFRDFHRRYYHPSNSRIFFYGDDNVSKRLDIIDEYLRDYNADPTAPQNSTIAWQQKNRTFSLVERKYPCAEGQDAKLYSQIDWLINDKPLTPKQHLSLLVLDHLLLGSPSSVLYKALMDSGIGEAVIGGGISDEMLQSTYSVGLKGISNHVNALSLHSLVERTLSEIVRNGFERAAILASMSSIEFDMREFNVGGYPKGLALMLDGMKSWIYNGEPVQAIRFEQPLKELKDEIANGVPVFENLIQEFLLGNQHRVNVILVPDATLETESAKQEEEELATIKAKLNAEELNRIVENTQRLQLAQQADDPPEAKATIPRLSLSDIDKQIKEIPIQVTPLGNGRVTQVTHDLDTAGILYADVAFDISAVSVADIPLLPLFCRMFSECGTSKYDRTEFDRRVLTHTGGLGASPSFPLNEETEENVTRVMRCDNVQAFITVRSKATVEKVDEMFSIVADALLDVNLDQRRRVTEMLRESKASMESSIVSSGHSFASARIASRYSLGGYIGELTGGLTMLSHIKQLLVEIETDDGWNRLLARLRGIAEIVRSSPRIFVNLTGSQSRVRSYVCSFVCVRYRKVFLSL
eukprot:c9778_g1_i3.p1 GENE.c9778_g1_i3~~c9778_g1_i3.p1  ORF type:complete len:868 (+),score=253.71 c9778_g1_i3:36-2606(+)